MMTNAAVAVSSALGGEQVAGLGHQLGFQVRGRSASARTMVTYSPRAPNAGSGCR